MQSSLYNAYDLAFVMAGYVKQISELVRYFKLRLTCYKD